MPQTSRAANEEPIDERRQHYRLNHSSTIRYQHLHTLAEHNNTQHAELCDFSGGGLRFLTKERLAKNEQLIVELHFSGWQENGDDWVKTGNESDVGYLKAIGAVMWCAEDESKAGTYEIGLRFTGRVR